MQKLWDFYLGEIIRYPICVEEYNSQTPYCYDSLKNIEQVAKFKKIYSLTQKKLSTYSSCTNQMRFLKKMFLFIETFLIYSNNSLETRMQYIPMNTYNNNVLSDYFSFELGNTQLFHYTVICFSIMYILS